MRRSKFEAGDGTDPISPSRRDFMKTAAIGAAAGSAAFVGSGGSDQLAQAQTSSPSTADALNRPYGTDPALSSAGHAISSVPVPTNTRCRAHVCARM